MAREGRGGEEVRGGMEGLALAWGGGRVCDYHSSLRDMEGFLNFFVNEFRFLRFWGLFFSRFTNGFFFGNCTENIFSTCCEHWRSLRAKLLGWLLDALIVICTKRRIKRDFLTD